MSQGMQADFEARKVKEMNSLLEPPEGSDFKPPKLSAICVIFSY